MDDLVVFLMRRDNINRLTACYLINECCEEIQAAIHYNSIYNHATSQDEIEDIVRNRLNIEPNDFYMIKEYIL